MSIQVTVMLMRKQNDQSVSVETAEMAGRSGDPDYDAAKDVPRVSWR